MNWSTNEPSGISGHSKRALRFQAKAPFIVRALLAIVRQVQCVLCDIEQWLEENYA